VASLNSPQPTGSREDLELTEDDISFGSMAVLPDRQITADSVEKVGLGFYGRKVRVVD
jgi:hypothetical protein